MVIPLRRAYHVVYDESLELALETAAKHNWTGIVPDISVPRFSPDQFSSVKREKLRNLSDNLNIEWGFHAPGDDVSLTSTYPLIRTGIVDYFKSIIDFARDVSSKNTNMVVHSGITPSFRKGGSERDDFTAYHYDLFLSTLCENLEDLIKYGAPDVEIVLENYRWSSIEHEAIHHLVPRGLKLCIDVPKLYSYDMELIEDDWIVFEQYKEAIEVVHLHDWSSNHGSHQIIGSGSIDFSKALTYLSSIPRSLQYVIEVRPHNAASESLIKLESLLAELSIELL
jgi:sugar phosphate isomerase/epimerase